MAVAAVLSQRVGGGPLQELSRPIRELVGLARAAREDDVECVLQSVTSAVHDVAGFNAVVFNRYRPAFDDYEVAYAVAPAERGVEQIIGSTAPRHMILESLLQEQFQVAPGAYFIPGDSGAWEALDGLDVTLESAVPVSADPDAWGPTDGLVVELYDPTGEPLALISVDEPASGRRPTTEELALLLALCSHAEQAMTTAYQARQIATRDRRMLRLLGAAPRFLSCQDAAELAAAAAEVITPDMGFLRAATYLLNGDSSYQLVARIGCDDDVPVAEALDAASVTAWLEGGSDDMALVTAADVHGPGPRHATRNGSGRRGWCDHLLLLCAKSSSEGLRVLFAIEEPEDRLLPAAADLQELQLLARLTATTLDSIAARRTLDELARRDPLTGTLNRRGLVDRRRAVTQSTYLLVLDLDHFKDVNDRLGHDAGDRVLARFGKLLTESVRPPDLAVRLGGEEFLLILHDADDEAARAIAERIVATTPLVMAEVVPTRVTVSIGLARQGSDDDHEALRRADKAMYAAKADGRNCWRSG